MKYNFIDQSDNRITAKKHIKVLIAKQMFEDGLAQVVERALARGGHPPAEQGVVAVVDDVDLAAGGVQDRLQAGLGDAEHRVEHDVEVPVWAMSSLVTSASASRPPSVKTLTPL